jgi:hypothetical protein
VGLEWGPLSLVSTIQELLERKVVASVQKIKNTAVGIRHAVCARVCTNFCDKRRLLSSLVDSGHGVFLCVFRQEASCFFFSFPRITFLSEPLCNGNTTTGTVVQFSDLHQLSLSLSLFLSLPTVCCSRCLIIVYILLNFLPWRWKRCITPKDWWPSS